MKKKLSVAAVGVALLAGVVVSQPQEAPEMAGMPQPSEEHRWLQQLAGEWDSSVEISMPGAPPMQSKGSETVRAIGGFWIMGENKGDMMGMPFTGILTLGYNAEKGQYVGTWIDSMNDQLWTYTGELDDDGRILTLKTEGPSPLDPSKTVPYRETIEIKNEDHKVFTSSVQGEDGTWTKMVTINYTRKG